MFRSFAVSASCLLGAYVHAQSQPYFQQQVDYRIDVRLDDVTHELHATMEFDYHNNAPNALDTLWIHLWPNAYRDRSTALCEQLDGMNEFDLHFARPEQRGYIDSLDFRTPDAHKHGFHEKLAWGYHPDHIDIAWLKLLSPLAPGSSITISTPFHVRIPSARFSRLGHIGQAYYITQWYPKPAVYDREGWHAMPYLTQGEFFSEFGSFDVRITLPENYVVGATGEQQEPSERAFMDSLAALEYHENEGFYNNKWALHPRETASSKTLKTIRFKQDRVHDFAWFADKSFVVRKGSVTLPRSGTQVITWVMFTKQNGPVWDSAITYVNESVRLYSEWVGDYPYSACTAVDGGTAAGGGMEYPMITIINEAADAFELDVVIAHEVGHNWFYGMLASNERDHPWMDEGINSFYEQRYVETRYPDKHFLDLQGIPLGLLTRGKGVTYRQQNEMQYRFNARRNWDQPLNSPSTDFSMLDYGTTVYSKGALVMDQLEHSLGEQLFDSCMQTYFNLWSCKHPSPPDVYDAFASQIWSTALYHVLYSNKWDPKVRGLADGHFRWWFSLYHLGVPFAGWSKGTAFTVTSDTSNTGAGWNCSYSLWRGKSGMLPTNSLKAGTVFPRSPLDSVRIDASARTLDIDRRNNAVRAHGLLKRHKLPEFRFLTGLEAEDRKSIYWSPLIGYNAHDGWIPGLLLRNTTFPSQRFEWVVAPLYGTQSERLAGGARFMWHHDRLRSDWFRNIHVGVSGFAATLWNVGEVEQWYQRAVPSLQLDLRSHPTAAQTDVRYRSVLLWNHAEGNVRVNEQVFAVNDVREDLFHEVRVHHERKNGLHPFDLRLTGLGHDAFTRLSLDAKWSAIYDKHKHRVTLRAFGGTFLSKNASLMRREMGWRLHWGSSDLLYDNLFFERQFVGQNTAQQFAKEQGGFKTPTANGTSDTWIAALNMEADFPFALPLSLFASYGAAPFTTITQDGRATDWRGYWEAGIGVRLVRDAVEMWVPLAYSNGITDEIETLRGFDFTERIRFVFALEKMDPTQLLRKAPH